MVLWRIVRPLHVLCKRSHSDYSRFVRFDDLIKERRCQARRSAVVQVNSEHSFTELHSYCSQFGNVLGVYHYKLPTDHQNFMLVEFSSEDELADLLKSSTFTECTDVIPTQSPFLWFRPPRSRRMQPAPVKNDVDLKVQNGCQHPSDASLLNTLLRANDVSDQMESLYRETRLNDLGSRLRYVTARQIECVFSGLFPDIAVNPFGSSINGFGKLGCDLDLIMKFTNENITDDSTSRLVFHAKKSTTTGRSQQQRNMEIIGDMIQLFLPGCSHVRRILQARIPIIKYNQDYTGLDCDLSSSSFSGLYMSELLYLYGSIDARVQPLVFTIRKWAQASKLTNPSPGKWITNFPLTLMVLFFLQNAPAGPILPSLNLLKDQAGEEDKRLTDDFVNCTFLRDIRKLSFKSKNGSSLQELLQQFFEFYAGFDFSTKAISINEGRSVRKIDHSALYIVNPLEVGLNVSKNVSFEECDKIRLEFRNACWLLELMTKTDENALWGISSLFNKNQTFGNTNGGSRLVTVKDLFNSSDVENLPHSVTTVEDSEKDINVENRIKQLKDDLENMKEPRNDVTFKDGNVEKQIKSIRRENEEILQYTRRLLNETKNNSFIHRRKVKRR